ncbi:hypothetical protein [Umezawaea sp. NPDC059074]|uniref:hypothetical protein n=1 Tax=Umezawaea sp. NPDC059074 TaxID=3346716 RepID=UPI0036A928F0
MFLVSVVLLVLVALVGIGLLGAMMAKDKPLYGVAGLVVLAVPGALLAIMTTAFQG